tara:strand:- start:15950 stop:16426 length:477 start_codon:yes stop_codon:yes gene_type:complete
MLVKVTNKHGGKGRQRKDREDRTLGYRSWRLEQARGLYTTDVDQVEWRAIGGKLVPVAILELTRVDGDRRPVQKYFDAIIDRFTNRDSQKQTITYVADKLNVNAFIVAYLQNLSQFYVYNLSEGDGWKFYSKSEYKTWLSSLGAELITTEETEDPFEL